jgi:cobalt-zinc-cadmium efflux system membrane fusion protein
MNMSALLLLCLASFAITGCGVPPRQPEESPPSAAPSSSISSPILYPPSSPKRERIRVAPVRTAAFPCEELVAPGKVEVNPNRISRIPMPLPGRIRQVHVRLGDTVAAEQPLLAIDSPEVSEVSAAYRQAQSQLRQARSTYQKAEADLARIRDLYEHRAAPLKEMQRAQYELTQAQAAIDQAQVSGDAAVHRMAVMGLKPDQLAPELIVRSPFSGKVMEIAVAAGEYRTDTSTPLLTIADLGSVWVAADVPESSIRLIQIGEAVRVELAAYPGEVMRGRVMRIADTVDSQTRTIKVQTELDNRGGRLRPEMFARIRHSHGSCATLVVPAGAILHGAVGTFVFVERGKAEFQQVPVKVGETRAGLVAILAGLDAQQRVVVEGGSLLRSQ